MVFSILTNVQQQFEMPVYQSGLFEWIVEKG